MIDVHLVDGQVFRLREVQDLRVLIGRSPDTDLPPSDAFERFVDEISGSREWRTVRLRYIATPRTQFAIAQVFGLTPLDLWPIVRGEQRVGV